MIEKLKPNDLTKIREIDVIRTQLADLRKKMPSGEDVSVLALKRAAIQRLEDEATQIDLKIIKYQIIDLHKNAIEIIAGIESQVCDIMPDFKKLSDILNEALMLDGNMTGDCRFLINAKNRYYGILHDGVHIGLKCLPGQSNKYKTMRDELLTGIKQLESSLT